MEYKYKKKISEEERKNQSRILLMRNPNKIPLILEKDPNSKVKELQKTKFLIAKDCTVNHFIQMIKGLIQVPEYETLFFAAKGKYSISGTKTMGEIYEYYKDKDDGFLYITYSSELFYG